MCPSLPLFIPCATCTLKWWTSCSRSFFSKLRERTLRPTVRALIDSLSTGAHLLFSILHRPIRYVHADCAHCFRLIVHPMMLMHVLTHHTCQSLRMALLCETINHYLLRSVQNLQPIQTMLMCPVEDIGNILTFHHITAPAGGFSDHLGLAIASDEVPRLAVVEHVNELTVGSDVALCRARDSSAFVYGRVSSVRKNTEVEIEVSSSEIQAVPLARIRKILSVTEYNAREEQIRAEAAERQKQALKADSLLFDGFAEPPTPTDATDEGALREQPAALKVVADQAKAEPIERVEYKPADPLWEEKERRLLESLKARDEGIKDMLEVEPPGIDDVLKANGYATPAASEDDRKLAEQTSVRVGTQKRGGYDLLRWGNIHKCAYFHYRPEIDQFSADHTMQAFVSQCVDVLEELCTVFDYEVAYVTVFYQRGAQSRFMQQRLMFNVAPIHQHAEDNHVQDIRQDPFAYMYLYGLMIHKLGHFHDIVHGTRHDFFMNELRIEFLNEWLNLLDSKGFDAAALETSELGATMLKQTVF
eukprot:m.113097 g.113097  ORF g.113097 m.113097 type:complete len:531 (+) comp10794_c0_seq2:4866-6458(+)